MVYEIAFVRRSGRRFRCAADDRHPVKAGPVRLPAPQRYYTFSEFNWVPSFLEVLLQVGADRMMFSTDHPHQSMTEATTFLAGLPLTPHDHERIAQGNAERVVDI